MANSKILLRIVDLFDVPVAFIASVAIMEVKEVLGIIGLIFTIGYTLYKWIKELIQDYRNWNDKD